MFLRMRLSSSSSSSFLGRSLRKRHSSLLVVDAAAFNTGTASNKFSTLPKFVSSRSPTFKSSMKPPFQSFRQHARTLGSNSGIIPVVDSHGRRFRDRSPSSLFSQQNNNNNDNDEDGWDNFDPTRAAPSTRTGSPGRSSVDSYPSQQSRQQQPESQRPYGAGGWVDEKNQGWDDTDNNNNDNNVGSRDRRPRTSSFPYKPASSTFSNQPRRSNGRNQYSGNNNYNNNNSNDSRDRPDRTVTGPRNFRRYDDSRSRSSGGSGEGAFNRRQSPYMRGSTRENDPDVEAANAKKTNLRALELAGYDHLYGLASVLNALISDARDMSRPEEQIVLEDLDEETLRHEMQQRDRKPEAQFSPWLFVQSGTKPAGPSSLSTSRSSDKMSQASRVVALATQRGVPIASVDKGALNTLSNNRPHQGYVLRCGKLDLDKNDYYTLSKFPTDPNDPQYKSFWLVLDEVVDPQNLGALLRSAYFLGCSQSNQKESLSMGVLICAKNSAPLSPTVSAASAGALELMMTGVAPDATVATDVALENATGGARRSQSIFSTTNLPRTLAAANVEGFRIVGASSSVPKASSRTNNDNSEDDASVLLYNLQDLPPLERSPRPLLSEGGSIPDDHRPTVLVLGSEGHGLRQLVAQCCTEFVRIPSLSSLDDQVEGHESNDVGGGGVDSLNVSVTGGILLWHFLKAQ